MSLRRLDVDEHVSNACVSCADGVFDAMGELVAVTHGHGAVYSHVQIDVVIDAHFADETFIEIDDTGNSSRRLLDSSNDFPTGSGIENFGESRAEQACACGRDYGASKQGSVSVSALPLVAADEREGNTEQRGDRRDGVGTMMPGVARDGGAFDVPAKSIHKTKKRFFDDDDPHQHNEGEWGRRVMRAKNLAHTFDGQDGSGGQNPECNDDGSQRLSFTMAIGMRRVGWSRRETQAAPNDDGAGDVERRFDAIGDERVRVTEYSTGDLNNGEDDVDKQAYEREARARLPRGCGRSRASLQVARRGAAARMAIHGNGND